MRLRWVKAGANPNKNALLHAARHDHIHLVDLFIKKVVNLEQVDDHDNTALMLAAAEGKTDSLK